jgi:hypothetical protein
METWLIVLVVIIVLVLLGLMIHADWRAQIPDLTMQGLLGTKQGGYLPHGDAVEDYKTFTGVKYEEMCHGLGKQSLIPPPPAESIRAALRMPIAALDGMGPPPGVRFKDWEVARSLVTSQESIDMYPPHLRQTAADYIKTVLDLAPNQGEDGTVHEMLAMNLSRLDS